MLIRLAHESVKDIKINLIFKIKFIIQIIMFTKRLINCVEEQLVYKIKRSLLAIILVGMVAIAAHAQDRSVSGTITDPGGESVPGATIVEKGTQNGVIADFDGNFKITLSGNNAILSISFVGYKTQEVEVGTRTILNVVLEEDIEQLAEVVVIGYGSVEKKDVTGTVAKVDEKEFNKGIISSPEKLLSGKVAGLQIESAGDPGGSSNIRLRGISLNGQNPLFVVDGVPLSEGGVTGGRNPLNFMNPADVENITVLKDASAAAIYGSRGANGVIIITTKNGVKGKLKVSYDGFYSISKFTKSVDMLTPSQFRAAIVDKAPQEINNLGDANIDWVDEVLQVAQGQNQNLSVSGGSKSTNYFVSFNYLDTKGVMRNTRNQSTSISLKLRQKLLNDNLTLSLNSKNGFTKDQFSPNVIGSALRFDPTRAILNPSDSTFGGYFQWNNTNAVSNPVASQDLNDQLGNTFRTLSNLEMEYKLPFLEGLSLKTNFAYDRNDGTYQSTTSKFEKGNAINNRGTSVTDQTNLRTSLLSEYYANYNTTIASLDSKIDVVGGYSWQNFYSDFTRLSGFNATEIEGVLVPADTTDSKPYTVENRLISFFGRASIDIKDKYLLTASLRRDGSTRFGESNRWGWFPSAAVAWRVLNEDFASGLTGVFSDLKFRVGYGVTGNQEIGDYLYNTFYKFGEPTAAYQFGDEFVNTLRPVGVDPDIKWEETVSTNFGIDAGMFGGRLNYSLEYYVKNVNDLLFKVAVPAGSNLSDQVLTNIGQVENTGFEFTVNGVLYDRDVFRWDLGFNVAINNNVVKKIDNNTDPNFGGYNVTGISGDVGQVIQVLKTGEEAFAFKTYKQKYLDGSPIYSSSKIDMYEDINGDGQINELDLVVGESPNPKLIMGLTSNMSYKSFELSFTLRSNMGNYVYNNVASSSGYFELLTDEATNNIQISAYETNFKTRQLHSDYYIENASFVKLDNITLGYNFDKVKFGRIKAYLTAQNLFTITGYSGVDPEIFNGVDNNLYPRSTTVILGLNASF
jgi:TonB-dependent starch-binding outer membrane protein SusC